MNDKLNSLMGKTVSRAELVATRKDGSTMDVLTVVFTDGSTLTVFEADLSPHLNGLDVEVTL